MEHVRIVPKIYFSFNDHPFRKPSFVIYFCGCPHKCKGCHSKVLQDPDSEFCESFTVSEVVDLILFHKEKIKNKVRNIVLLGGDPVVYEKQLIEILSSLREKWNELESVVLYTGFLMEELSPELREKVDIIVDGKYRDDLKTGKFPASSNQRVWVKTQNGWVDFTDCFLNRSFQSSEGFEKEEM